MDNLTTQVAATGLTDPALVLEAAARTIAQPSSCRRAGRGGQGRRALAAKALLPC